MAYFNNTLNCIMKLGHQIYHYLDDHGTPPTHADTPLDTICP